MLVLLLEGADLVLMDLKTGIAARLKVCFAQCTCVAVCSAMSKNKMEHAVSTTLRAQK